MNPFTADDRPWWAIPATVLTLVAVCGGGYLLIPDREEPMPVATPASSPEALTLPVGQAGWVGSTGTALLPTAGGDAPPAQQPAMMIGPHYAVQAVSVAVSTEITIAPAARAAWTAGPAASSPAATPSRTTAGATPSRTSAAKPELPPAILRPSAGGELLSILLTDPVDGRGPFADGSAGGLSEVEVRVEIEGFDPFPLTHIGDGAVVIAGVPAGAHARLAVEEDGRRQALDLRTGKRIESAPDLVTGVTKTESVAFVARPQGGGEGAAYYSVEPAVELSSWWEGKGYAPDGSVWLLVATNQVDGNPLIGQPDAGLTVDQAALIRLRTGGRTLTPFDTEGTVLRDGGVGVGADRVFQVPDDFRSGTFELTIRGTMNDPRGGTAPIVVDDGPTRSLPFTVER